MRRWIRLCMISALTVLAVALPIAAPAQPSAPAIGIVIMHGKGGSPSRIVNDLASGLERKGWLVVNLEMPWSGRRGYDADVAAAEQQVNAALEDLRGKGAKKVFVAGHSQGGVFTLYYASKHPLDGIIAIAPGGSSGSAIFRQQLGASVEQARGMIAAGKGDERAQFLDYEGSRGTSPVRTTAAIYLSWFDPDGAMNQEKSARSLNPGLPVLYVAPRNDYPGLQRVRQAMYGALPANPLTRLYEPDSDHLGAPSASIEEIARWAAEVAAR